MAMVNDATVITNNPSAADTHKIFVAIGLMLLFVVIATVLAGISQSWGDGVTVFMIALLIVQGITHGQQLSNFFNSALGGI